MLTNQMFWSVFWICLVAGFVAYRIHAWFKYTRPFLRYLDGWKIDPRVRHSSPLIISRKQRDYWPRPPLAGPFWSNKLKQSYCLRCGIQPFTGPTFRYSTSKGFNCLCWICFGATDEDERLAYAKMVIDVWLLFSYYGPISLRKPISFYREILDGVTKWIHDGDAWPPPPRPTMKGGSLGLRGGIGGTY